MKPGTKVYWHRYTDAGEVETIPAEVTGTFYEPGDPVMGVNLRLADGTPVGGVDSQDVTHRKG
jgi:hypothetical protein